jgi:hypothetical protein
MGMRDGQSSERDGRMGRRRTSRAGEERRRIHVWEEGELVVGESERVDRCWFVREAASVRRTMTEV